MANQATPSSRNNIPSPPKSSEFCSDSKAHWKGRIVTMDKFVVGFSALLLVTGIVLFMLKAIAHYDFYLPAVISSGVGGSLFFCGLVTYCCSLCTNSIKDAIVEGISSQKDEKNSIAKPKTKTPTNPDNLSINDYLQKNGVFGVPDNLIAEIEMFRKKKNGDLADWNIKLDAGILLWGPTGTGKTTIAKHISRAIGVFEENIYTLSPGDLKRKHYGEAEKTIDEYLKIPKGEFRVIILEEGDGVAKSRQIVPDHHQSDVLAHFLSKIDGAEFQDNLLLIVTTNVPNIMDSAFMRRGRVGKHFQIIPPNFEARKKIFAHHLKSEKFDPNISADTLAANTENYSCADLVGLLSDAQANAVRRNSNLVIEADFTPYLKSK